MKNVISKLQQLTSQVDLGARFGDNFDTDLDIFTDQERQILESCKHPFDKNIKLKGILRDKYNELVSTSELDFWIINNWGGIRGFKKNDKNLLKVERFKKQLSERRLSKDSFSTISSLSKLSSFMHPYQYFIYDSRVIYALNWLILTCENNESFNYQYFPMPIGRNKIIADFDMNTIINISHINAYLGNAELFISDQEAYFDYCDFIISASKEINGENSMPYLIEMLLFTIANTEVFDEICSHIKLTTTIIQ